ncbi:MAG: MFS transporter [Calditrichaeota bacterium]|nr:MFS transporter [Calditrichota bacterium]
MSIIGRLIRFRPRHYLQEAGAITTAPEVPVAGQRAESPSHLTRYMTYAALMGAVPGLLGFGEVIARKSLGASALEVTALTMIAPLGAASSLWWARLMQGRSQGKFILLFGSLGALSVASGMFLSGVGHLLAIWLLYHLFIQALFGQAENRVLQQHTDPRRTGRVYGLAQSLAMGIAGILAFGAGIYMDRVDTGYRHIFLPMALILFGAVYLLGTIPTRRASGDRVELGGRLAYRPVAQMIELLTKRPDFLRFETAFMLYGIAFMMILPVVPLYLVDDLELTYRQIGTAQGAVMKTAMILAIPVCGRFFDRSTPHRMGTLTFWLLATYPLLLLSALLFTGTLRLMAIHTAFAVFGIAMSGVVVLWNLSSIRFSGGEDSNIYQSVHVAATSIRGSFAPLLGLASMSLFGRPVTLAISSALWMLAGLMMIWMRRLDLKRGDYRTLRAQMHPVH